MTRSSISDYLSSIGKKGGQAKGRTKRRGNAAYYRELAKRSAAVRRAKAKGGNVRQSSTRP
jgi:hypothetical protein